jgi:tetratricopeptide (TPR) repeat protein
MSDSTESFSEVCKKAEDAVQRGQYATADKIWEEIAEKYPDNWTVFYNWGTTLVRWGNHRGDSAIYRYQKACIQFEKASNLNDLSDQVYYNWGNAYAKIAKINPEDRESYYQACEKYKRATEINSVKDQAFYNWGTVLSDWAKLKGMDSQNKCLAACENFQKATEINPNKYEAFNNWGLTLVYQAKIEGDNKLLLQQAETVFLKSEEIKKGHSAYNLACIYALLGDEEKCRQWLKLAESNDSLTSYKTATEDEDLASVRDNDWFKKLKWKDEI